MISIYALLIAATEFIVPLHSSSEWIIEKYRNIKPSHVEINGSVTIQVNKSASPTFYVFEAAKKVKGFEVVFETSSLPKIPDNKVQGDKGADDFVFRLGLVESGKKKPPKFQLMFAPDWLNTLVKSFSGNRGLGKVYFFNVANKPKPDWSTRTHPASDILKEEIVMELETSGSVTMKHSLKNELSVEGLWLSADGDDTDSEFSVIIKKIRLEVE